MRDDPIGVFDSGVGGLAVVEEIRKLMPHENILYYADRGHFPYGERPHEEVKELAVAATRLLLDGGAKVIVVACNTATGAAISTLRASFAVPFVGMEPAIKPASIQTRTGKIGVMATETTIHAPNFQWLVGHFAQGVTVKTQVCPQLVELVEEGETDSPRVDDLLREYLGPLIADGIDTLVLGCTHYTFLRASVQAVVGPGVDILDAVLPVARQVERVVRDNGLARDSMSPGWVRYMASGDYGPFMATLKKLISQEKSPH